jgi:ATP phosphoribosyltransferase
VFSVSTQSVARSSSSLLRLALPNKGRLHQDTRTLLADAGYDLSGVSDRTLRVQVDEMLEVLFVRAQDIPQLIQDGLADVGVTGWDLVKESDFPLVDLLDLGFGRCRLVVATTQESQVTQVASLRPGSRVATSFPNSARRYFSELGLDMRLVDVTGAAEVAPHMGIADVIVDLTSSGETLRANGLRELATIVESTARLVCRSSSAKRDDVQALVLTLDSVLRARSQRYLLANVPLQSLERVKDALPGLSGPTVARIEGAGGERYAAISAVVSEKAVRTTISALRALGCVGILVTRIERLVP